MPPPCTQLGAITPPSRGKGKAWGLTAHLGSLATDISLLPPCYSLPFWGCCKSPGMDTVQQQNGMCMETANCPSLPKPQIQTCLCITSTASLNIFTRAPLSVPFCYYKAVIFDAWVIPKGIHLSSPTTLLSNLIKNKK